MGEVIKLKSSPFECAKVAVKRSFLYGDETINGFIDLSFDEILKYMEEHDFKVAINSSYLQYEGFYLVERILNVHLARVYKEIFKFASDNNKILLEAYYLKYQIQNLVSMIRCKIAGEKEIEGYLVGDESRKLQYVKAYDMPKLEDGIVYICKKLGLDYEKVLEIHKNGLFDLENYLFKIYYEKLRNYHFIYNGKDEFSFFKFNCKYIDLLNARTFMKLKFENIESIKFGDIFIRGGNLRAKFFKELEELDNDKCFDKFSAVLGKIKTVADLDKMTNDHIAHSEVYLKKVRFGSPFYIFKYLFEAESETRKLRILLKGKHLGLEKKEIMELIK